MFNKFLDRLFNGSNERDIKKMRQLVEREINPLEESLRSLSDSSLANKTNEFKARLANGETLDDLLPEAFAVIREASRRVLGMRHFDVQLIGGIILHRGNIAEMSTGEGKTLVATAPVYLNALEGKGVHVITVNDYLAKRDSEWMGQVYKFLGLSVGLIVHDLDFEQYPEEHCLKAPELLREGGVGEDIIHSVVSHGYGITIGCGVTLDVAPEHEMEKVLFAADELTGLIWAAALMRPSKSTKDMELKSLKKKYKSKGFAAGCSREVIQRGADQLGWELEKLLTMTMEAMKATEDTINAECESL